MPNSTTKDSRNSNINNIINLLKNAYSGHPKEIWSIVILMFINRMGTMVLPFLSVYLTTELDYSLRDAGIIASAFGFGSFGGSYIGGKLTNSIGARKVIIASLFMSGLMFISLQFVTSFHGLFIFIFLTALFGDAYRPASMTAIGSFVPKAETGRTMALYRLAINLGMTAAPLFGGLIAVQYGYKWLFWLDGVTCILSSIYFLWVSRNWKRMHPTAAERKENSTKSKSSPAKDKKYLWFLFSSFLIGFVFVQWFHTIPVFIKTEWGFDERYIGLMMALSSAIIVIIEMPLIHTIEKRGLMLRFMKIGVLLIGASFLFFMFPGSLILCFASIVVLTFGEILFLPFNNSIPVYMSENDNRGEYTAWYWMCWSLVMISAPLFGFIFVEEFGWQTFWIFILAIIVLSWWITARIGNAVFDKQD